MTKTRKSAPIEARPSSANKNSLVFVDILFLARAVVATSNGFSRQTANDGSHEPYSAARRRFTCDFIFQKIRRSAADRATYGASYPSCYGIPYSHSGHF